jgi:hypothetical protein
MLKTKKISALEFKNIFDTMQASQLVWAGYYDLTPSNSRKVREKYDEDVKIIGSIHDELLLEVPEDQAEMYAKMLSEIMNRIGSELLYPVPVTFLFHGRKEKFES